MKQVEEEFDMVVLSLGLEPSASLQEQAQRMGVVLNRWGFAQTSELSPAGHVAARRVRGRGVPGAEGHSRHGDAGQRGGGPGDGPVGPGPRNARADEDLSAASATSADEPPRVGVFICHCGSNIASVVDVERVVQRDPRAAPRRPSPRTTSTPAPTTARTRSRTKIAEHRLNRVVVASCTPRTHEPIFRDTLRDAGLNPYLLEMANIRDQCSWVHSGEPDRATEKAIDLVRMAVGPGGPADAARSRSWCRSTTPRWSSAAAWPA